MSYNKYTPPHLMSTLVPLCGVTLDKDCDHLPAEIAAAYREAKARGLPDGWMCSIDKRNRRKWTAPNNGRSCDSIPKALAISVDLGLLPTDTEIIPGRNRGLKRNRPTAQSKTSKQQHPKRPYQKRQGTNSTSTSTMLSNMQQAHHHQQQQQQARKRPGGISSGRRSPSGSSRAGGKRLKRHGERDDTSVAADDDDDKEQQDDAADEEEHASDEEEDVDDEEEEDSDDDDDTPPEPMDPEQSFTGLSNPAIRQTTVHWDPNSSDGRKIGWRVRIAYNHANDWVDGRVVRFDPYTHKHKVEFYTISSRQNNSSNNNSTSNNNSSSQGDNPSEGTGNAATPSSQPCKMDPVWIWLRNDQHNLQLATRMVWAHVKGYAWWPALVMETNVPEDRKDGFVQVEFFGSGETAKLRDTAESVRPFSPYELDAVVARHKKKRNQVAYQAACEEYRAIVRTRNQAARYYAMAAFTMAQYQGRLHAGGGGNGNNSHASKDSAQPVLGRRVQFFRSDVNYPYGDTVSGRVRKYSSTQKKWLVSFEYSERTHQKYEPAWINLQNREAALLLMDVPSLQSRSKKAAAAAAAASAQQLPVREEDLIPYIVGFEALQPMAATPTLDARVIRNKNGGADDRDDDQDDDDAVGSRPVDDSDAELAQLLQDRCRGCVEYWKHTDIQITCQTCQASFHMGCFDPPITTESWQRMLKDGSYVTLRCSRCMPCRGCYQKDIVFGSHAHPAPKNLTFPPGEALMLCSMCKDAYDDDRYCPNCAHSWDDVKFKKVQKQIDWFGQDVGPGTINASSTTPSGASSRSTVSSALGPQSTAGRRRKSNSKHGGLQCPVIEDSVTPLVFGSFTGDEALPPGAKVDPSWYFPETSEWGYTEVEMLVCDGCDVWVHAGCAGVDEDAYDLTSEGKHPIYSKEFLCRICCRQRCRDLIGALQQQDSHHLFAEPVSDKVAPNYRDVIKNPMDLRAMRERAETQEYWNYSWVREMFELMVLNALTFNQFYTTVWNEASRFYQDCLDNVFKKLGKAAPKGRYDAEIQKNFALADDYRQKEEERVQVDSSIEKKDLVAGSMAVDVTLPELRSAPPDRASCLPFREVVVKPIDAFFFAWMDCCYTCGSSGAADTMLFCVDCGEAFHSFCVSAPVHSMEASSVAGWRCPNCKICEISGDVPQDETRMLFCEMCDRAFSLDLLDPPLTAAPAGLWICGQCVDCKNCGNSLEENGASLRHWSRFPDKCYRCGGCDGLVDEYTLGSKCSVCSILLRRDDADIVICGDCSCKVHVDCDERASDYLAESAAASRTEKQKSEKKYFCPSCYRPPPSAQSDLLIDRKKLSDLAWETVMNGNLPAHENYSLHEMHGKIMDEMDWQTRELWRDEYIEIIRDGLRLLVLARSSFGNARVVAHHVMHGSFGMPAWAPQRALRFIVLAKRRKLSSNGFTDQNIAGIVSIAKLAAAFVKLACRALELDVFDEVSYPERMNKLLHPYGDAGTVALPLDPIKNGANAGPAIGHKSNDPKSDRIARKRQERIGKKPPSTFKIASPLCGWPRRIGGVDNESVWNDPRECCLCHICGDDDAGFPGQREPEPQDGEQPLPPLGRLLPVSDGNWVHTSCALWSSEVWEAPTDGLIHAVEKARARGAQLKCFGCGRHGATVGCNKSNCPFNYHFQCAKACGAVFTANQHLYCATHRSSATDVLPRESIEFMKALMVAPEKKITPDKEPGEASDGDFCSRVGSLTLHSLGAIETKVDGFHNENYIMPPGYVATRIFWSMCHPRTRTVYVLRIQKGAENKVEFSALPGDDPSSEIKGSSAGQIYSMLVDKVRKVNVKHFSLGNQYSKLPVVRRTRKKTFGLNGPQFFGFGLNHIRKQMELSTGVEAVVAPLTPTSPKYKFCFVRPEVESILDLQRKRAAAKAEQALENASGCARTEGIKAVTRSGGSGRITRALVRSAEEDVVDLGSVATTKKAEEKAKADRNLRQLQYRRMKAVPMEQRLVARRSHIHGYGLFTKIDIVRDDPIVEYMGEVIRQPVADKRERVYEVSGEGSCYMFRLDLHRIVDATIIGCMARFMNHSCQSNAYAKIIAVDTDGGQDRKIVVFAKRNINAGEEITYDYKFPVEDGSLRCTCGAPTCIGRLN